MDTSAAVGDAPLVPVGGPGRSMMARLRAEARRLIQVAARIREALRRQGALAGEPTTVETPDRPADRPRWAVVAVATAGAAGLLAFRLSPATALYWYAFPLFGIGVAYVIQFRSELTGRWWAVLGTSAVVSAVALAGDWAFSGHVLFNVLLLGHAGQSPTRRTWIRLLLASLVELFVLKFAFQRPMDAVGGVVSVVAGIIGLALAGPRRDRRTRA